MAAVEAEKLKEQGNEFFKSGEYETAIRYYTNAIVATPHQKKDSTQSVYYSNRARCHKMIEQFKEGLEDAQRAIEQDNKNIKAHLLMGECLCMLAMREKEYAKIDTAITRMTKGSLDPTSAVALRFARAAQVRGGHHGLHPQSQEAPLDDRGDRERKKASQSRSSTRGSRS